MRSLRSSSAGYYSGVKQQLDRTRGTSRRLDTIAFTWKAAADSSRRGSITKRLVLVTDGEGTCDPPGGPGGRGVAAGG